MNKNVDQLPISEDEKKSIDLFFSNSNLTKEEQLKILNFILMAYLKGVEDGKGETNLQNSL